MIRRELRHMGAKSIDIRWPKHLSLYRRKQAIHNFKFERKSIKVHKRISFFRTYMIYRYMYVISEYQDTHIYQSLDELIIP